MKTIDRIAQIKKFHRTTGIGSLPHHNVDAALEFSFKMGIPFLPQIPIRNPWEFMIAQALEGLPGLRLEGEGVVALNVEVWKGQSHILDFRLKEAFARDSFESFEPSASISSCWQPFLWELQERSSPIAKIQIAGPLTCQWALKLQDGSAPEKHPDLCGQIFQLILARSIALVKRMRSCGITPILFLDEPGLYALDLMNPRHLLAIQELKLQIQTLRKEGALVGIHCCSNTVWDAILGTNIDFLSVDTHLSLPAVLGLDDSHSDPGAMVRFLERGGRLSLGIIPTGRSSILRSLDAKKTADGVRSQLNQFFEAQWQTQGQIQQQSPGKTAPEIIPSKWVQKVLEECIFTPACGLALQSTSDVELILEKLMEAYEHLHSE